MPTYSMKDTETGEEFELSLSSYKDLEPWLESHPTIKQVFRKFPGHVDPVTVGVTRTDNTFRDVLKEVKKAHIRSTVRV